MTQALKNGVVVDIFRDGEKYGRGVIRDTEYDDGGEVVGLSVDVHENDTLQFANVEDAYAMGWRRLFRNPMPGPFWAYNPRAPLFSFTPCE